MKKLKKNDNGKLEFAFSLLNLNKKCKKNTEYKQTTLEARSKDYSCKCLIWAVDNKPIDFWLVTLFKIKLQLKF